MSERAYQAQLTSEIYEAWSTGAQNVLAVLPTGGGKSHIVSGIIATEDARQITQCVIAHRTELVSQMSLHVASRGVMHRIIAPSAVKREIDALHRNEHNGRSYVREHARCAVVAVDTLNARADDPAMMQWCASVQQWITDEAHHITHANKWGRAAALFPSARGLGVTATPLRADGLGLGRHADGIIDAMVQGPSMRQLINAGYLADYEIVCPTSDIMVSDNDISPAGDFSPKKLAAAAEKSRIVGDVVEQWFKHALHKRTIVFATDVETANKIAQKFKTAGVRAESLSAKTPSIVRDEFVKRFKNGALTVLINVDLFGEGFDCPACDCVVMARPTASLAVYLQQFGRALRTALGKLYGLIIDMVSNFKRHGFPDKPHVWTLDRRDKRARKVPDPDDLPLTACVECSRPYIAALPACPHCGHEPIIEPRLRGNIEQIDGDLMLLDRAALAKLRAAIELPSAADAAQRAMMAAGPAAAAGAAARQVERIQAQARLRDVIELWAGHQRAAGRSDRESYRRFYAALGMDVLSALALPRKEMDTLSDTIGEWIK